MKGVDALIATVEAEAHRARRQTGRPFLAAAVIEAMRRVPRDRFVDPSDIRSAWDDRPLPIGHGQTISQPFIVALMTDLADVDQGDIVLEVGTGCGYQTAVLARLARHVYSVERVGALAQRARRTLDDLGVDNVTIAVRDGHFGWQEHAPYDAIVVTAAAEQIPPALIEQLNYGGRLVLPVGSAWGPQKLIRGVRRTTGLVSHDVLGVRFVPLLPRLGAAVAPSAE